MSQLEAVLRFLNLLLAVSVFGAPLVGHESWSQRVIDEVINVPIPVDSCTVPGRAMQVARTINQAAGTEFLPEACEPSKKFSDQVSLNGLTAREALDKLVSLDPRYTWVESDGVIVVRPLVAWTDPDHFLHRTVNAFSVPDQHIGGALAAITAALRPYPGPEFEHFAPRTPQGGQRFSVERSATSIFDALNAIVRAHGALFWTVNYCQPPARHENARVGLQTFDGSGLATHAAVLTDASGRRYSPCRGKSFW
jgi:hypothetical protein